VSRGFGIAGATPVPVSVYILAPIAKLPVLVPATVGINCTNPACFPGCRDVPDGGGLARLKIACPHVDGRNGQSLLRAVAYQNMSRLSLPDLDRTAISRRCTLRLCARRGLNFVRQPGHYGGGWQNGEAIGTERGAVVACTRALKRRQ
jgi:hypothetical protein